MSSISTFIIKLVKLKIDRFQIDLEVDLFKEGVSNMCKILQKIYLFNK